MVVVAKAELQKPDFVSEVAGSASTLSLHVLGDPPWTGLFTLREESFLQLKFGLKSPQATMMDAPKGAPKRAYYDNPVILKYMEFVSLISKALRTNLQGGD